MSTASHLRRKNGMSRTTDNNLQKEAEGELIYSDSRREYLTPDRLTLSEEIDYLGWEISRCKSLLREKVKQFNKG